jgi:hypothetical protein
LVFGITGRNRFCKSLSVYSGKIPDSSGFSLFSGSVRMKGMEQTILTVRANDVNFFGDSWESIPVYAGELIPIGRGRVIKGILRFQGGEFPLSKITGAGSAWMMWKKNASSNV